MIPALGKLAPHPADHPHRQLKLARYAAALPDPPPTIDWRGGVAGWGEYGNAGIAYQPALGDCALVAPANAIRLWTAHAGSQKNVPLDAVLDAYRWAGSWDGTPGTDRGCIISDVLAGWHAQSVGIGGDVLAGFVEVEHRDQTGIRQAIALFGCVILGVQLPNAAKDKEAWTEGPPAPPGALAVSSLWGGPFDLSGDWAPGSWGGHCLLAVAYDIDSVTVVSWGNEVTVSWHWLSAYVDEAWAPLSADWIAAGRSPSGFDLPALQADLATMADTTEIAP